MTFDRYSLKEDVAKKMWRQAWRGTWDGRNVRTANDYRSRYEKPYFDRCIGKHEPTGTILIFTRDEGMHTSGWWKNPDFERCFHLSVSFRDPETGLSRPRDVQLSKDWVEAFYHDDRRLIWAEPPYSPEGKGSEVWHYRVFADANWQPFLPRKEVYSKDFTEIGWLSFSDLNFDPHPIMP